MAFEGGNLNAMFASAGEDAVLMAELRGLFVESLVRQIDVLRRARCDGNWTVAAMRLKGLGASFNAPQLIYLAEEALDSAASEPTVVRKLEHFAREFDAS